MNLPRPALVTQSAAQCMPRWMLWLLCTTYILPGQIGRGPWKNADVTAFGIMSSIAEGRSPWIAPTLGGVPVDAALLPYWLGAASIQLFSSFVDAPTAARLPFAALLAVVLALTWLSTFELACMPAAQPIPLAFGGEAKTVDYARAMADGSLLAVIATLGLAQLGHETTPEIVQLAAVTLALYGLAVGARGKFGQSAITFNVALLAMTASGAPALAALIAVGALALSIAPGLTALRPFRVWFALAGLFSAGAGLLLGAWAWRLESLGSLAGVWALLRQLAWFVWPCGPLALITLWRWRAVGWQAHIAIPALGAAIGLGAFAGMGGSDRALMLSIPGLAVLAAFALPTLKRSATSIMDWFSLFFFSFCGLFGWTYYAAMHTGLPEVAAANLARLYPVFIAPFSLLAFALALLATISWVSVVRWRVGRNQHPLWTGLILPATGVAWCWLLLMTLWLPLFDHARSYQALVDRLGPQMPREECIAAPLLPPGQVAAFEQIARVRLNARPDALQAGCKWLLRVEPSVGASSIPAGWTLVAREARPTDRSEFTVLYRRKD